MTHPHTPHSHNHEQAHAHAHDHAHSHDHGTLPSWPRIGAALFFALLAEVAHWLTPQAPAWHYAGMAFAVAAIALSGWGIYRLGLQRLLALQLGIHALMAVAVTGAFVIGQWPEAAMVMALYAAAERIEDQAMDRARDAIAQLLKLTPQTAEVLQADDSWRTLPTADITTGSHLRIAPGACIPLDGVVHSGHSTVNQAPVTGESLPADKAPGDTVWAGSINQHAELTVQVTAPQGDSLLARIVRAVQQAQNNKAPTQRLVDRFAAIYTPAVMVLALALAVLAPWLLDWPVRDALYQALALLVIACPCALVLATPVTVVSALTAAARHGVLLKGGSALEAARQLHTVALDKTGTLTTGQPTLVHWQPLVSGTAHGEDVDIATTAWALAARSEHPVARAIAQGLQTQIASNAAPSANAAIDTLQALPGHGVQAQWYPAGHTPRTLYLVNPKWVQAQGLGNAALDALVQPHTAEGRSVSLLATDTQVLALFAVADTLRPHAAAAMHALQAMGVRTSMLSGDHPDAAQAMARQAGIAHAQGGLLPEDKLAQLRQLQREGPVAMVGDGINDAPALAQADLGIAMGGAHSTDIAMETADVVLLHDDLQRLPQTIALSRRAHRVLWQNIALALGLKLAFFALALAGHASMWMAVAADMGVSLLVVANGLRLRKWVSAKSGL